MTAPSTSFRILQSWSLLEQIRKTSANLSTAGVPQRFKPGTLQIQETSVTAKVNLLFVAVGRLNVSCVRCHQTVPFFWWLCAIYRVSINSRWNNEQISLPLYTNYGESSLPRYASYLMLFTDSVPCKSWIKGLPLSFWKHFLSHIFVRCVLKTSCIMCAHLLQLTLHKVPDLFSSYWATRIVSHWTVRPFSFWKRKA
jgi:hypothetical protein